MVSLNNNAFDTWKKITGNFSYCEMFALSELSG